MIKVTKLRIRRYPTSAMWNFFIYIFIHSKNILSYIDLISQLELPRGFHFQLHKALNTMLH